VVWGFDETKVLVLFGDSWFGSFEIAAGTGRESFPCWFWRPFGNTLLPPLPPGPEPSTTL